MLERYEEALEQWIESVVSHGDDDALFACGYLQGHVAVVLSQLEELGESSFDALENKMTECLALAREELNDDDFALVETAWSQLHTQIASFLAA
ncbi:YfcL family protein [Shewanella acanthi]|uniref:YfcL family protein n=1 Tax=Shewanella acanthi TaxID=2864212 RepID=UPI001C65D966|nr:YfcL family protein [Shewanella acanthi]QYJ80012.1 YfcL family protein [Shewanella acanthi]